MKRQQPLECNPSNGGKKFSPKKYRRALREAAEQKREKARAEVVKGLMKR